MFVWAESTGKLALIPLRAFTMLEVL